MDIIQPILTGMCTGFGVGFANWLHDRKISKTLDKIDKHIHSKQVSYNERLIK